MTVVRVYDTPEQFAEMMMRQLSESMNTKVSQDEKEPLLLDVQLDPVDPSKVVQISLHNTFLTYMNGGDLNSAIDYLNNIVRTSNSMHSNTEIMKLDSAYIYPAIRDEQYVLEAGRDAKLVSSPFLPGLRVIYLEIKNGCTKMIGESLLQCNPRFTEDKVKRLAYVNLKASGWYSANLNLTSPLRSSCTMDIYTDPPHPIDCQFSFQELASQHMPNQYVIAYTNRLYTIVMRSTESMKTTEQAKRLVKKSRFDTIVKRSVNLLPNPVSDQIYLVSNGEYRLL